MGHAVISDHAGLREMVSVAASAPQTDTVLMDLCQRWDRQTSAWLTTFIRQSDKTATLYTQRTVNMDVINECRFYFDFMLPSELLFKRKSNFLQKFNSCSSIVYHFGFVKCVKCV